MSHKEDAPKNIQDQVKQVLSNLGEFLDQPAPAPQTSEEVRNWGQLFQIMVAFKCTECASLHYMGFSPTGFLEVFAGMDAKGYFENFSAIGMFHSGQLPVDKSDIDRLLQKAEVLENANEGLRKHLVYIQSLADDAAIRNSHLQVQNNALRRELDRSLTGREQPGETALDFPAAKRHWKFGFGVKKIRVIGGEGQQ